MSSNARSRLAAQAAAAGYPPDLLALIANATQPTHEATSELQDPQIEQVSDAVEVLAQAGYSADSVRAQLGDCQRSHGADWRQRFWSHALNIASDRYRHPERHGLSPYETDSDRLAEHATRQTTPAPNGGSARGLNSPHSGNGKGTEMTMLAIAPAPADAPAQRACAAASLAARIEVPRQLPVRYDGQRLRHLSNSSYTLWATCPDSWRRRYILGQRTPQTAGMFLGSRVDDALSDYYRQILAHGEPPALDELLHRYRAGWNDKLEAEHEHRGVIFDEFDQQTAIELGARAIEAAFEQLIPQLGTPVAVQRKLTFKLADALDWSIEGYLDLETQSPQPGGDLVSEVVDYKVKGGDAITAYKADRDPQASLYLAGRWLEGQPAARFAFAQVLRPGRKRKRTSTSLISTTRTVGQLRSTLARIALAASQISAHYDRYGPDRPWGFADPASWKCSERYCEHWQRCPGGAGL